MILVDQFRALGVTLWLDGEALRYRAPVGVMDWSLLDVLVDLKPLLIEELSPICAANTPTCPAPDPWGEAVAAVFQKLHRELTPPQQARERELRESLGHAGLNPLPIRRHGHRDDEQHQAVDDEQRVSGRPSRL